MSSFKNKKQLLIGTLVILTISFGWKYPILGYIVPVVMLSAVIISIFKGRYHCGNICPRAMFYNTFISPFSKNKKIPSFFKNVYFRASMMILMIIVVSTMGSKNATSFSHWGFVFWKMCVITTGVGILLGILFKPRIWCSFCPIGSMQNVIGGNKSQIHIAMDQCKKCKICEKDCPLDLKLITDKGDTQVTRRDCIKCSKCVTACPKNALELKNRAS